MHVAFVCSVFTFTQTRIVLVTAVDAMQAENLFSRSDNSFALFFNYILAFFATLAPFLAMLRCVSSLVYDCCHWLVRRIWSLSKTILLSILPSNGIVTYPTKPTTLQQAISNPIPKHYETLRLLLYLFAFRFVSELVLKTDKVFYAMVAVDSSSSHRTLFLWRLHVINTIIPKTGELMCFI